MCCPLVFEFSVCIGVFVIGLGQISFFFSLHVTSLDQSYFFIRNINYMRYNKIN